MAAERDLDGRTFLVTGGNTGIGLSTATELARRGGRVYIGCRSMAAGEAAVVAIKSAAGSPDVWLLPLDLSSLTSVRACAAAFLARPWAADAVTLRRADDSGKVEGLEVRALASWTPLLQAVSRRDGASGG